MKKLISIIIPIYNEQRVIKECVESLISQSYEPIEIILVDDGSTDGTIKIISNLKNKFQNLQLQKQGHRGPGPARNLGAKKSKGEILVFVDADMTFGKDFIKDLTRPIIQSKSIGTFSKNEMVSNYNNIWSICWNINRNVPKDRMLGENYPDTAPVFRAILKSEFEKVNGFDATGEYTDDWSLSRKLGVNSTLAKGATYFHQNPANLMEVWKQARWIGKNEFISGTLSRRFRSLIYYSIPTSAVIGFTKSIINLNFKFLIFKFVYDLAVWTSTVRSFFKENKFK